jgi:hypothetical protein
MEVLTASVVRGPGYKSRDPMFDTRRHRIFSEVVCLERGPLSLVIKTQELHEWKISASVSRKPRLTAVGFPCADHETASSRKSWH